RDRHEQRRIGEGDGAAADVTQREIFDDVELVDRVIHDRSVLAHVTPPEKWRQDNQSRRPPSSGPGLTTPADRMTLRTPPAKPSTTHGDVPSKRSNTQPKKKPIATPPTSSADSRMPRAKPDMSVVDPDAGPGSAGRRGPTWSSRSPRRRSLAESAASSAGRDSPSFPRVSPLMSRHPPHHVPAAFKARGPY